MKKLRSVSSSEESACVLGPSGAAVHSLHSVTSGSPPSSAQPHSHSTHSVRQYSCPFFIDLRLGIITHTAASTASVVRFAFVPPHCVC